MAQTQSTANVYPLLPEGWHLVKVLASTRKDTQYGTQLGLTLRLMSDKSQWNAWLSVPKSGGIPTKHLIAKLIAACRGLAELPEGVTFDDEIEPVDCLVEIESKHGVKGAKSKNAGDPMWMINDIRPAPKQLISAEEAELIRTAIRTLFSDVPEEEVPVKAAELVRKALKLPDGESRKVSELSPDEAKVVKSRIETLAEMSGKSVIL